MIRKRSMRFFGELWVFPDGVRITLQLSVSVSGSVPDGHGNLRLESFSVDTLSRIKEFAVSLPPDS